MKPISPARFFVAALAISLPAFGQESDRDLERPGEHNKHLTIDTVDRWMIDGLADEVLRVDVRSGQFDPVLQLVRLDDDSDRTSEVLVPEVDDPGSESRFLKRLPSDGRFAILVHGPGQRGGGNYRLNVERLRSEPFPEGADYLVSKVDDSGMLHVRVAANKGDMLVPRGSRVSEIIDPMGFSIPQWNGCFEAERDGEHYLRVRADPGAPCRVGLAPVRRRQIADDDLIRETLEGSGLDEWTFTTKTNSFLVIELEGAHLEMQVVQDGEEPQRALDGGPTHRWLPSHSKGLVQRMILVTPMPMNRKVMVRSHSKEPAPYTLTVRDTSRPLSDADPVAGSLVVGASDYWTFKTEPGEVLRLDLESSAFDPYLRLFDQDGVTIGEFDDVGGGLAAGHSWLVRKRGFVRAQVHSFGNGGGGEYTLQLARLTIPTLSVGETRGPIPLEGGVDYVHLDGKANLDLLIFTASDDLETGLTLYDPDGIALASNWGSGVHRGALISTRLPRDGRYTLAVTGRRGIGSYTLRVINPMK